MRGFIANLLRIIPMYLLNGNVFYVDRVNELVKLDYFLNMFRL